MKPPFLPILGWKAFPSVDIPELFNWGHAHVYLIETAPNWTTAFDFSDTEEECFSQDMAENVGQTNIPQKGKRFLDSGHILQVMDCRTEEFYFVKARIQASMVCKTYFTSVTKRRISGSVRDSTCFCRQRSKGRCSHVAKWAPPFTARQATARRPAETCHTLVNRQSGQSLEAAHRHVL